MSALGKSGAAPLIGLQRTLQLRDVVWAKTHLIKDRRECFEPERSSVTRHGGTASGIIAETELTAARTHNHKSAPPQFPQQFVGGESRKPRQPTCSTCDGNFDMLQSGTEVAWRNVQALLKHIFEAEAHRVAGVLERLFDRVTFRNNAWESGHNSRVPADFVVRLQHNRKNPRLRHNVNVNGDTAAALRRRSGCGVGTGWHRVMVDEKGAPRCRGARKSAAVFDAFLASATASTRPPWASHQRRLLMPNGAIFAETPVARKSQRAAVNDPPKRVSCGRPISWTRRRDAAARQRTASYCSGNRRQTMQKRH